MIFILRIKMTNKSWGKSLWDRDGQYHDFLNVYHITDFEFNYKIIYRSQKSSTRSVNFLS